MPLSQRRYRDLVTTLIDRGVPKSPQIIEAFRTIDRSDFLPSKLRERAYENVELPIGFGQMTTEPFIVGFMLELLQPLLGQNILEIGAGCGWQTALLACIVGESGKVTALEIVPGLKTFCEENLEKYNFTNVSVIQTDGMDGWNAGEPYDRILASAAVHTAPSKVLVAQLKVDGRLLIPVISNGSQSLHLIERIDEHQFREKSFHGFVFPAMKHAKGNKI